MANNCYNHISISGSVEQIAEFKNLLDLDNKDLDGCDRYENIRTVLGSNHSEDAKWFDMDSIEVEDESVTISGDSAWCPSLGLFQDISEKYPSFDIKYFYEEMGCDFCGWADISEGQTSDNCFKYWEGKINMDRAEALESAINNELDCYDTEEELIESDMYQAFNEEEQADILEAYRGRE